ncbi:unnamed protein product [Prunus armeniaca]|uniref:Uncharacterized protein n=1 Tax=Prunus armeniaca TaxID=36596 RepID=A0A6J5USI4_PRUAR|nr:unnamed protein product [Prunus armeniaca]
MINTGLVPDEITFLGVLSACCHGGLVEDGRKYFSLMTSKFNLFPELKHYSSMVDLLGRAGLLQEAEELIHSMPIKADAVVWGALFFACYIHKMESHMWEEAEKAQSMMKERGVEKTPGCSSIEVNGAVHEFIVRDKSHPQSKQIYDCLVELTRQMELVGSISEVSCILGKFHLGAEFYATSLSQQGSYKENMVAVLKQHQNVLKVASQVHLSSILCQGIGNFSMCFS